jgi:UDP-2,4-diacetamido-2,4,6-trideoxy-beta-L-altropyranose hydrolase
MLVVIRTDASKQIGSGHLMRCLTLAEALREKGATVEFICREHAGHLCDLLEERQFVVHRLPAGVVAAGAPLTGAHVMAGAAAPAPGTLAHAAWLGCDWTADAAQCVALLQARQEAAELTAAASGVELAPNLQPDWLIVDHYALDFRWQRVLRSHVAHLMVIDDLADRQHDCDVLLDQNLVPDMANRYKNRVPPDCTCLLGPQFAMLQPLYASMHQQHGQKQDSPQRILAFFGGVDAHDLSSKALEAFIGLQRDDVQFDLVLSGQYAGRNRVETLAQGHANIHLYSRLPTLAPLMAQADLALGAGGATTWERLCMGLPTLVVTLAENQRESAEEQQRQGLVQILGHVDQIGVESFAVALQRAFDEGVRVLVPGDLASVVDGNGVSRVIDTIWRSEQEKAMSQRVARAARAAGEVQGGGA